MKTRLYSSINKIHSLRWTWLSLLVIMLLAGCRESSVRRPAPAATNLLGMHLLLTDGAHDWPESLWPDHMAAAQDMIGDGGYVLILMRLDDLDQSRWQLFFDLCRQKNLTPIIRLATAHDPSGGWTAPPADANGRYQRTAEKVALFLASLQWPTGHHVVTIGNEPNHGGEWGGRPDPAAYAQYLVDMAVALHAADPQAYVLNGALDPYAPHTGSQPLNGQFFIDSETFLDEMYLAEPTVFQHIDGWASHSYPLGPFIAPPWEQVYGRELVHDAENQHHAEPPPHLTNRGVNGYEWELWKLAQLGVQPLPVFITETGWRHEESVYLSADKGAGYPSAELVATYVDMALRGNNGRYPALPESGWTPWLQDDRVHAVVFFALDGVPRYWGHTNWLRIEENGEILGTYPMADSLQP